MKLLTKILLTILTLSMPALILMSVFGFEYAEVMLKMMGVVIVVITGSFAIGYIISKIWE